jgi:anti-sigma B factor antagonist
VTAVHMPGLRVAVDYDDGHAVLAVDGELDVYTCGQLRAELLALSAAGHHRIALDLSALAFCDSSGLGVMVGAVKRARNHGGGLSIYGAPEHLLRMLRITGLVRVMPPFEQRAEALGWLAAQ